MMDYKREISVEAEMRGELEKATMAKEDPPISALVSEINNNLQEALCVIQKIAEQAFGDDAQAPELDSPKCMVHDLDNAVHRARLVARGVGVIAKRLGV